MALVAVPGATAVTESLSRVNGFIQGCGEAGVLIMAHVVRGTPVSTQQLTSLIREAVNSGHSTTSGGATTLPQLQWLAQAQGVPTAQMDWQTALRTYTGKLPIEIGVSNASALGGNNVGVAGHYIDVLGVDTSTGKFLVADPNQPQAKEGKLVEYSAGQIQAAAPFGAIVPQIQQLTHATQASHTAQSNALLADMAGGGGGGDPLQPLWDVVPGGGAMALASQHVNQATATATGGAATSTFQLMGQGLASGALSSLAGPLTRGGLIVAGAVLLLAVLLMLVWSGANRGAAAVVETGSRVAGLKAVGKGVR